MTFNKSVMCGHWREEKTLGSGGFGTVTLWRNTETDERRAVKKCRMINDMSHKQKQRWEQECNILIKLKHQNVIRAFDTPRELDGYQDGTLPLMFMEYCEGGDLRKMLNMAENACGLPEPQVRHITHDIGRALEYLHTNKIMHRDLKPENIVIHRGDDDKTYYKLIDLGYAKELDQSSVCSSFVGTMQYLAPELFVQPSYTYTVDFWSFGTLTFEVVVGYRPFLHNVPPIKCHNDIKQKTDDDIHAFFSDTGNVKFSKQIPLPHYLCRTTTFYYEQWLRLMLKWNPSERGGNINPVSRRYRCFEMLDSILSIRVLQFFVVPSHQTLAFPIPTRNLLLRELLEIVSHETDITVNHQEILLASGTSPDINGLAEQCVEEKVPSGHAEWLVYLFNSHQTQLPPSSRQWRPLPESVSVMVNDPHTLMSFTSQKQAYSQAIYFTRQTAADYQRLFEAYRAALLCLIRHNSIFTQTRDEMNAQLSSLTAKLSFFELSQEFDIERYLNQSQSGISSEKMYSHWLEMKSNVNKFKVIEEEVKSLEEDCQVLQQKVLELHRSPYARNKENKELSDITGEAIRVLDDLKKIPADKRRAVNIPQIPMVQLILKCLHERKKLTEDLYVHISKVLQCKQDVVSLTPTLQSTHRKLTEALTKLEKFQLQRQKDVWQLVHVGLSEIKSLKKKVQHSSSSQSAHPMVSRSSSSPLSNAGTSLTLDRCTEMSISALQENSSTRNRLTSILGSLTQVEPSVLSWNFLKHQAPEYSYKLN